MVTVGGFIVNFNFKWVARLCLNILTSPKYVPDGALRVGVKNSYLKVLQYFYLQQNHQI